MDFSWFLSLRTFLGISREGTHPVWISVHHSPDSWGLLQARIWCSSVVPAAPSTTGRLKSAHPGMFLTSWPLFHRPQLSSVLCFSHGSRTLIATPCITGSLIPIAFPLPQNTAAHLSSQRKRNKMPLSAVSYRKPSWCHLDSELWQGPLF